MSVSASRPVAAMALSADRASSGPPVEHPGGATRLDHDDRDVVRDHVVELARDPLPLLAHGQRGPLLALALEHERPLLQRRRVETPNARRVADQPRDPKDEQGLDCRLQGETQIPAHPEHAGERCAHEGGQQEREAPLESLAGGVDGDEDAEPATSTRRPPAAGRCAASSRRRSRAGRAPGSGGGRSAGGSRGAAARWSWTRPSPALDPPAYEPSDRNARPTAIAVSTASGLAASASRIRFRGEGLASICARTVRPGGAPRIGPRDGPDRYHGMRRVSSIERWSARRSRPGMDDAAGARRDDALGNSANARPSPTPPERT